MFARVGHHFRCGHTWNQYFIDEGSGTELQKLTVS